MAREYVQLLIFSILLQTACLSATIAEAQVVVNEVCTYNGDVLEDEDGDEPDWIELYNGGTVSISLLNYSLQGGTSELWRFPQISIQPQEYLILFASGKNRTAPFLHTNFKLSKDGEVLRFYSPSGGLLDSIAIPGLHPDHSSGRKPDGASGTIGIFSIPTPGASNQNSEQYTGYSADPVFSLPAGFYNGSVMPVLTGSSNSMVYFTTDGSIPDESSALYAGPLFIDSTKVVRACAFSILPDELPSHVVSNTYIINYETTLPVFSISTDPDNLWDWNTGIYVTGPNASPVYPYYGANFWEDWEVAAHIEFFETDGSRKMEQTVGLSIHGGSSNRTKPMKSLRLSNKSKYGEGEFKYRFFNEKIIDEFKIIILRNSSGDFNKTHFRDGSLHKLLLGKTNIDLSAYRPSVVFLNGMYHGVHNIREKISKYYLEENYGIDGDRVDLLEEESTVIEGDFQEFNAMHAFVTGNNMADPGKFEQAALMIDTGSLCDYYIAETFLSNIDWPYNNIKFWRLRDPQSKWRYILIDLDIALGNNGWAPANFDVLGRIMGSYGDTSRHVQLFRSLLQNTGFREYFINRYADLVNTLFSAANMTRHIMETREVLLTEMPAHFIKWGNDMAGWDQEIYQVVMPHVFNRPGFAMEQVRAVFNLDGIVTLELDVWPPGAGVITINTISPGPLPWKGDYFDGNPVTISVAPNSGYKFVKWDSDAIAVAESRATQLKVNPDVNNRFTAYFSTSEDPGQLMVYPNPASGLFRFGCLLDHMGKGRIEVIDAPGQTVLVRSDVELHAGINELELDAAALTAGMYMLRLYTEDGLKSARMIIF